MSEQEPTAGADELLPQLKAARHLGITPELLFSYTRARFRKSEGQARRLATVQWNGATLFRRQELDDFDEYLKQPWADVGAERTDPPKCVLDHLRAESCNQCVRCGSGIGVQTAHIAAWAVSRSHYHHNLIRICSTCHIEHDDHNSLSSEELLSLKQRGIARTRAALEVRLASNNESARPPARDPLFFGRAELIQDVREALQGSHAVQIRGPGGIGKTQLLLQAFAGLELGRKLIWIEVERYRSPADLRAALEVISRHGSNAAGETLPRCLDAMHACVVFDGVEQLRGEYLDGLDDLLMELQGATVSAQYVVTSQVNLQRAVFDEHFDLASLEADAGGALLQTVLRDATRNEPEASSALLEVAEGHPLTLRLIGTLANHYGSTYLALQQIERRGVSAIEMPKRRRHDRGTCLSVCLSLAYDALDSDEALLAYLVASSPGGLHAAMIESDRWLGGRGRPAIAGLQRWSFIHAAYPGESHERLTMLSPIALYVTGRWKQDFSERAHAVTNQLVEEFAIMAAVIDGRSREIDSVPYLLARYEQELPNLLLILDAAEAQPENDRWSLYVAALCTGLMRFFFVLNLPDLGVYVMLRGTRISLGHKDFKAATDLLVQTVSLAGRSGDVGALNMAERMVCELEVDLQHADAETRGNVEQLRAMFAQLRGRATETERHARLAIGLFESAESGGEDVQNDLSSSFGLLGDALLEQRKFDLALSAYQTALSQVRGASVAVNVGQLLHQVGNCESGLGRHESAAACYLKAANHFHEIGMREFVGNALGELGHAYLDTAKDGLPPKIPAGDVLTAGLDDVSFSLGRCLTQAAFRSRAFRESIRKLFGVVVVLSLSDSAAQLEAFGNDVNAELVQPAAARCEDSDDDDMLLHLAGLCALAAAIAAFERDMRSGVRPFHDAVKDLAMVCLSQGPSPDLRLNSFVWLALYLRLRWSVETAADVLHHAAERVHAGHPFQISV